MENLHVILYSKEVMKIGITIKELSEISGYSPATISRVITNKENVREETRIEIQKLLSKYNYKSNFADLKKATYRERTILLLIGDISNQFYIDQITYLVKIIRDVNYIPLLAYTSGQIAEEEEFAEMAVSEGYAGMLFLNVRGGDQLVKLLTHSGIPVVFLNRTVNGAFFDSVCSDNYRGGYIATKYLIERGHRKIGHLAGNPYSNTTRERIRGYEDAMKESGLIISKHSIYYGNLDRESGYEFGEKIIKENSGYTAIFCGNDLMADGLNRAFYEYGVRVPEDISIICYDDTIISQSQSLTRVSSNPKKMGERAVELLLKRIRDRENDMQCILFSPVILSGESVRPRE